jgi:hypothetical protein
MPSADKYFSFSDLNGHAFNSFLYFNDPELQYPQDEDDKQNTTIQVKVDYGLGGGKDEVIYWGDGRLNKLIDNVALRHQYTLEYLGEYFDKKGRLSSKLRLQDSEFWQRFSYVIRSGLKVEDWESTFLNLVHPAGLKFFASVILLVIRDNHWYGPRYINFDPVTRQNDNLLRIEDEYLAPFRTKQPLEDLRWLESLVAPSENGGYHLPMFQPGWLQGDIRTRRFMFEAGLWTKLARSVPGNNLASKYSVSYSDGDPTEDFDIRVQQVTGDALQVGDVVTQGTNQGVITQLKPDGNEFTGLIKRVGDDTNVFADGVITVTSTGATATILATQLRNQVETISVYGAEEQNQAYLLQDTSSIDINSEMFVRSVLMAFKYVIPALVPQKVFTKRDFEQNLKFKEVNDISCYLPITIKDALNNSDVFMNVGAIIKKINQLDTEDDLGFVLETDTAGTQELLIDDHHTNWWNDQSNNDDVSAPVEFTITSIISGGNIVDQDTVFQNITNDEGDNITLEGLIVGHDDSGANRKILIAWKSAFNTDTLTTLPSRPEADTVFKNGTIFTVGAISTVNNISAADTNRIQGTYTIDNSDYSSPSGDSGTGATFSVDIDGTGAASITITNGGTGYYLNDTITISNANLGGVDASVDNLTSGVQYEIVRVGTTDFTTLGAADSNVGTIFTYNGTTGTGSGLARIVADLTFDVATIGTDKQANIEINT